MNSLKIQIGLLDVNPSLGDVNYAIWGDIHISINDICFPDEEWYDAVSSLLDIWAAEIIEFVNNKKQCVLRFMDGPFLSILSKIKDDYIAISCRDGAGNERASTTICTSELLQSFLDCIVSFIEKCCRNTPNFMNTQTYARISNACYELNDMLNRTKNKTGDGSVS